MIQTRVFFVANRTVFDQGKNTIPQKAQKTLSRWGKDTLKNWPVSVLRELNHCERDRYEGGLKHNSHCDADIKSTRLAH